MRRIKYNKKYDNSQFALIFSVAGASIVIGLLPIIILIVI